MGSLPLAVLDTVFAFASCAPVRDNPKGFGTAQHVLVIGCGGLGGMYLENATSFLPNIAKFYSNGSTTTRARNQMPSASAPNWATIITGMGPEETGIRTYSWVPANDNPPNSTVQEMPPISGKGKLPETMWHVAHDQNVKVEMAVVESSDWIHYLVEPDVVKYEFRGNDDDAACANAMHDFIVQKMPDLMFIHFNSIHEAANAYQWGSPDFYVAVKNVDGYIGHIFDGLTQAGKMQDTLIILTADHGGYRFGHGFFSQSTMYIPALFMGPGVMKGYNITSYVTNKDFAPTALNALGLQLGKYMQGKIVEEIYN